MSTNALIVFRQNNKKRTCNCILVNFDGYIQDGVGETLYNYWTDNEENKKLCAKNNDIRSFGINFGDIEFYYNSDNAKKFKCMKNIMFNTMKKIDACYTYIWDEMNPGWNLLKNEELIPIGDILNY